MDNYQPGGNGPDRNRGQNGGGNNSGNGNNNHSTLMIFLIVTLLTLLVMSFFNSRVSDSSQEITYDQFRGLYRKHNRPQASA